MGLCWLVMVDAYLRPSELVEMLASQVVPKQPAAGMDRTALHINPDYRQRRGKTGELDESVLITRSWLGTALETYARKRSGHQRLWDFSLAELRLAFLSAAEAAGITFLKPVLYMARHSGASLDRLNDVYSLEEVQKRGRWRCMSSVRRYEKHALLQEVVSRLAKAKLDFAYQCAADVGTTVGRLFR